MRCFRVPDAMPYIEIIFRSLAAIILAGSLALVSYALALQLLGRGALLRRLCASGILGLWIATVLFHGLIWSGQFRLPVALATLMLLMGGTLRWIIPAGRLGRQAARDAACLLGLVRRGLRTLPRRVAAAVFLLLALHAFLRAAVLPPLGWDTLTYHGVKAALWVQQGGPDLFAAPGGWGSKALLPGGSEVFHAWAMLPFRSDLAVGWVDFFCWLLLGLMAFQFCRELALPPTVGVLGVLYLLFLPALRLQVGSGYGELPLMVLIFGGLLFSVHSIRKRKPADLLLGLLSFGLAAGIKSHVWPALGWVVLVLGAGRAVLAPWKRDSHRTAYLLGLLGMLLVVLPWFGLNLRAGHPPLSPFPIRINGWVLGLPTPTFTAYHHQADEIHRTVLTEARVLWDVFQPPFSSWPHLGLLTLPIALIGFVAVLRRNGGPRRAVWLTWGFMAIIAIVFFSPTFDVIRQLWSNTSARFLLPAAGPAFLAGTGWLWSHPAGRRFLWLTLPVFTLIHAGVAVRFGVGSFEPAALTQAAGILLVPALVWMAARRGIRSAPVRWAFAAIAGAVALAWIQDLRDRYRYIAVKQSHVLHWTDTRWAEGARRLDDPAIPRTLACTTGIHIQGDNWFLYYFLGRRFQNRLQYVPPTRDGRVLDATRWEDLAAACDYDAWRRRLLKAGISQVVCLAPWAVELKAMDTHPDHFRPLYGEKMFWGVYEVLRDLPGPARSQP